MRPLFCAAVLVAAVAACSHDWDLLEPGQAGGSGGAGTSTSTQGGSTGTQGGAPECTTAADCMSSGNACTSIICDNGSCVTMDQTDGSVITPGNGMNCLDTVCQGGQPTSQPNSQNCNDPVPDNCVVPNCTAAGTCEGGNAPQGYPCTQQDGSNGTCDGDGNCT